MLRMFVIVGLLAFNLATVMDSGEVRAAGSSSSGVKKDFDYESGVRAIKSNKWHEAIKYLKKSVDKNAKNADALNWLGYAHRKLGNYDEALAYYERSLSRDPRHKGAHEYIGEAYLGMNNLAKAEEHLAMLDEICTFSCNEYRDLKHAIDEYKENQ